MLEPSLQPDEKILQIALKCELDRLRLRIALLPAPTNEVTIAGLPASALTKALSFSQYLPGKLGQLARWVFLGSSIFRVLKPLAILGSKFKKPETRHDYETKRTAADN